jgi:hypothetical protein
MPRLVKRKSRVARVLKAAKRVRGKSKRKYDKMILALKPGKRVSAYGNVYYEYRANRSDVRGRVRGKTRRSKRGDWL